MCMVLRSTDYPQGLFASLPMMIPSWFPDINMEAVLEGNLKCLIARKGERRYLIVSSFGTVR